MPGLKKVKILQKFTKIVRVLLTILVSVPYQECRLKAEERQVVYGMNKRQKEDYAIELATVDSPSGLSAFDTQVCIWYVMGCTQRESYELTAGTAKLVNLDPIISARRGHRILNRPEAKSYLRSLIARLEDLGVASALEIQMFLTDVIRTPPSEVDSNHRLCQRVNRRVIQTEDGPVTYEDPEMVNKMDALKTLVQMKGLNAPVKLEVNHNVGVMVVPMSTNVEEWQANAEASQAELVEDARVYDV